jgi:hypothetical protein
MLWLRRLLCETTDKDLLAALESSDVGELESRAILRRAEADFDNLTSYVYVVVHGTDKTRNAYAEEIENPNEFLTAEGVLHMDDAHYKKYALVLWAATGYARYAKTAGLSIVYTRLRGKSTSNAIDVASDHSDELIAAFDWWGSAERRSVVSEALNSAQARAGRAKYTHARGRQIDPRVDWETAARAVVGLRAASAESRRSARCIKYGKEIRPDEKARFIREYIAAENAAQGAADDGSAREVEDICAKIESYARLYPLFDNDKTRGVITTVRRSGFLRVSVKQAEYLRRVLRDAEAYHALSGKERIGGDLLDLDVFFGF